MDEKSIAVSKDFIRGTEPIKICFDLEISPLLAYTFEAYESNAQKLEKTYQIISYSYSINDGPVQVRALPDFKGYKPGVSQLNDKELVKELYEVVEQADVLYGHNIKKFDLKHMKGRFIYHGLRPTKKWIVEDTLFMAKKYFKFPKNNLDFLCEQLGIGTKTSVRYDDLIWGCIDGDLKKWELMKKYNKQDVVINKELYKKLAPWHETHYNLNLIRRPGKQICPNCASDNNKRDGTDKKRTFIKQRYRCLDCGKYWVGEIIARVQVKEEVITYTERVDQT